MNSKINKTTLWLLLIIFAGILMRVLALTTHSMWWDELQSLRTGDPANTFADINAICDKSYDPAPRSFYFILNIWFRIVGFNDITAKLFVMLFGVASIPVMYKLGELLVNKQTGLIAAAITAFNYYTIYYSLEVRFYPVLFFLSALSHLYFLYALNNQNSKYLIAYALVTLCLIITHYFAILIFVSQVIVWIFITRNTLINDKRKHLIFLSVFALILLAYLPFLSGLLKTLHTKSAGLSFNEGDYFFTTYFSNYFGGTSITVFIALVGFFAFMINVFNNKIDNLNATTTVNKNTGFIILAWLVIPVTLAYLRTVMGTSTIAERYCIVILPALVLGVAFGFSSIKNTELKFGIISLFIVGSVVTSVFLKNFYSTTAKDDFKGVVSFIKSNQSIKNNFYVYSDKNWHFLYYYNQMGLKPICIEQSELCDARFFVGKVCSTEAVIKDSTLKDIWITSAHFANLENMKRVSWQINSSLLYLKIDSFIGKDAFADHYIRKDWDNWYAQYPFKNIITIGHENLILKPAQLLNENGTNIVVMWDGETTSLPIKVNQGSCKFSVNLKGTQALDSFPSLDIYVNEHKIGTIIATEIYQEKELNFNVSSPDTNIVIKLKMTNDFYDAKTTDDRNVFIKQMVIKSASK